MIENIIFAAFFLICGLYTLSQGINGLKRKKISHISYLERGPGEIGFPPNIYGKSAYKWGVFYILFGIFLIGSFILSVINLVFDLINK